MSYNKVNISGMDTASIKSLKTSETIELLKKLKAGDKSVRDTLVLGNLRLVLSILKKFQNRTDNLDDLFQVGCLGLLKAIDNFDLSHNVKFSTYAVPMIIGEIKRYLRDNNIIRVSRSLKDISYQILKVKDELTRKNNRTPSNKEVAEILNISEYELKRAVDAMQEPVSIFDPIYSEGGDTIYIIDQLSDEKTSDDNWELSLALEKGLDSLSKRESHIIRERYFVGKTQMEIAEEIGISQAQVSRIEKSALNNIKKYLT